ncbi:transposable element Tcb2 transposase [Trichonephila clavipes]|nr:transposable element Tcb2 transposase [Trichonephila clavipes]
MRRRLAEGHLGSRCPLRVLPLTPSTPSLGVVPRSRGNWTAAECSHIVFSDESRFHISSDDNRVRVWRPRRERLNLHLLYSDTPLPQLVYCLQYKVTPRIDPRHHDILQTHVLPFMQWLPGAIFQQDNVRPHTARVSVLLLPFLGLPNPQICLQSSIFGIIWDGELGIPRV